MKPLLSIIIPTYNRAHLIEATLDSIKSQDFDDWECIVVDDGSTDNTPIVLANYVKEDGRFRYLHRPKNRKKGPNSCRNFGFENSSGKLIQWFDSDDLYKPQALKSLTSALQPRYDVVVAKIDRINLDTGASMKPNKIRSATPIKDYFVGTITFYVCGPMWARSFLEKQPYLFDEDIRNLDDWDFNLRMLYAKPRLRFLDTSYIYYRIHPDSFSKELKKINIAEIKSDINARRKHLKLLEHDPHIVLYKKYVEDRIRFFYKTAMRNKQQGRRFLLQALVKRQLANQRILAALNTVFVHFLYLATGKGDKLLK